MSHDTMAKLTTGSLRALADALDVERWPNAGRIASAGLAPPELAADAEEMLRDLRGGTHTAVAVATMLRLVAAERERAASETPRFEVVWSGPEAQAPEHRTTLAVVHGMFQSFRRTLLISSYVTDAGDRAREFFGPLAERLDADPALRVCFFVNVPPPKSGSGADAIAAYRTRFRDIIWPGHRLPDVWYDPRSVAHGEKRGVLHAKCVIADDREALVTSANLTTAAHERNVELGVLITAASVARDIARPFMELIGTGQVERLW